MLVSKFTQQDQEDFKKICFIKKIRNLLNLSWIVMYIPRSFLMILIVYLIRIN